MFMTRRYSHREHSLRALIVNQLSYVMMAMSTQAATIGTATDNFVMRMPRLTLLPGFKLRKPCLLERENSSPLLQAHQESQEKQLRPIIVAISTSYRFTRQHIAGAIADHIVEYTHARRQAVVYNIENAFYLCEMPLRRHTHFDWAQIESGERPPAAKREKVINHASSLNRPVLARHAAAH